MSYFFKGCFLITLLIHQRTAVGYQTVSSFAPQTNLTHIGEAKSTIISSIETFPALNSSTPGTDPENIRYFEQKPTGHKIGHRKKHHLKPYVLERRQSGGGRRKKSCFKQTCKQTISGRNLRYRKALDLIQSEEYLSAADKDSILRLKRYKRSPDFKKVTQYEDPWNTDIFKMFKRSIKRKDDIKIIIGPRLANNQTISKPYYHRSRTPRQASQFAFLANFYCGLEIQDVTNSILSDAYFICSQLCPSSCYLAIASFDLINFCRFDLGCLTYYGYDMLVTDFNSCIAAGTATLNNLYGYFCANSQDTTTTALPFLAGNAPQAAATVGALGATAFVQTPPLPMVAASGAPPGVPTPGLSLAGLAAGGLNPAVLGGAIVASALLLVPVGLVPIAVFPPYTNARTIPAISVIFAEDPNIMKLNDDVTLMRTRRAIVQEMRKGMQKNYRRPSLFSSLWKLLLDKFRVGRKKIKFIKDEIMCLRTKVEYIKMKIKQKIRENREGKKKTTTTTTTTERVVYRITTQGPSSQTFGNVDPFEFSEELENGGFNSTEQFEDVRWVPSFDSQETFNDDGSTSGEFRPPATLEYFSNHEIVGNRAKDDHLDSVSNLIKKRLKRQSELDKEMDSMDDCFEDMPEPKYGFKTEVIMAEDSPCDISSTCKLNAEDDSPESFKSRSGGDSIDRQTGEDFSAEGPTSCRVKLDTSSNSVC